MPDLERLDDRIAAALLPARPARGHKGTFGKLLVVAGSLDYAGAALLVCRAAGRAGAGLVTLAVPESLQPLFAAKVVEATTMPLVEDDVEEVDPEPALARILDHDHDALVIGPGLRPSLATGELVRSLLGPAAGEDACAAVVDAEALRSLAAEDGWWEGVRRPVVLTPHAGEFARLRAASGISPGADGDLNEDDEARCEAALDAAATWGHVVVLKGAHTVIAAPDGAVAVAPFENPGLATGRHRRRARRHDGGAPRPGALPVRRRPPRRLPARHGRRRGARPGRRRRAPRRRPPDRDRPGATTPRGGPRAPGRRGPGRLPSRGRRAAGDRPP